MKALLIGGSTSGKSIWGQIVAHECAMDNDADMGPAAHGKSIVGQILARQFAMGDGGAVRSTLKKYGNNAEAEAEFAVLGKALYETGQVRAPGPLPPPKRPLYYIATMAPCDDDDLYRIDRHRAERDGWGFSTIEQPRDIGDAASHLDENAVFLLDSLTTLLANEMFGPDAFRPDAGEAIFSGLMRLLDTSGDAVLVSDDLFADAMRYDETTEAFRRALGRLHRNLAAECNLVLRMRCGLPEVWKWSAV